MKTHTNFANSLPLEVRGPALKRYLQRHTNSLKHRGMHIVKKDLKVFKKVYAFKNASPCIANLIIPTGAVIYTSTDWDYGCSTVGDRKMRASRAIVNSIARCQDGLNIDIAYSSYCPSFVYKPGKILVPNYFDLESDTCTGGIHFFLNLSDAFHYK